MILYQRYAYYACICMYRPIWFYMDFIHHGFYMDFIYHGQKGLYTSPDVYLLYVVFNCVFYCFIYMSVFVSNDEIKIFNNIMSAMASQMTSLPIVYSTVYPTRRLKKTSKLRGNSPHKTPVTRKKFPFDDVIMIITMAEKCFIWWTLKKTSRLPIGEDEVMLFLWKCTIKVETVFY